MTQQSITQSIVCAPDFWGTTLRMAMITDSVSHTESVITDYCLDLTSHGRSREGRGLIKLTIDHYNGKANDRTSHVKPVRTLTKQTSFLHCKPEFFSIRLCVCVCVGVF